MIVGARAELMFDLILAEPVPCRTTISVQQAGLLGAVEQTNQSSSMHEAGQRTAVLNEGSRRGSKGAGATVSQVIGRKVNRMSATKER